MHFEKRPDAISKLDDSFLSPKQRDIHFIVGIIHCGHNYTIERYLSLSFSPTTIEHLNIHGAPNHSQLLGICNLPRMTDQFGHLGKAS